VFGGELAHPAGLEEEPFVGLDGETGGGDDGGGVAGEVAAAGHAGPDRVDPSLPASDLGVVGKDVFVEPQFAAGADDTVELGERGGLVGDGAEHEGGDTGVDGGARQDPAGRPAGRPGSIDRCVHEPHNSGVDDHRRRPRHGAPRSPARATTNARLRE